jgi:UDP-glucose 4-epimerase
VVVTGAGGFIGAALCAAFAAEGRACRAWVRGDPIDEAVAEATAIVHAAGRAQLDDTSADARTRMTRDNVELTEALARAAEHAGVARFVHLSSVKAGAPTVAAPADDDFYGRTKREAEDMLVRHVPGATVLRLPLVYGPGAGGNFRALVDAVAARRWLPLGAVDNRRRLLSIRNLVGAVRAALDAPQPVAGVHFVGDANAVATPELVRAIAAALGVEPHVALVPVPLLRLAGALTGRSATIDRLTQSLDVDIAPFTAATGWRPAPFAITRADVARQGTPAARRGQ